ncbi:MAG: PD-(D/E)XK nuclease family protein, partial [Candidatus Omnitrophota bacterium]
KFDKIEPDNTGALRVVDYKTGAPDNHVKAIQTCKDLSRRECDDYYRQLVAYKLVFDKSKRASHNKAILTKGKLQFLEPASKTVKKYGLNKGEYKDIELDLNDEMVRDLEKVIEESWKNIQSLNFEKLPERDTKEACKRCDFDIICWGS